MLSDYNPSSNGPNILYGIYACNSSAVGSHRGSRSRRDTLHNIRTRVGLDPRILQRARYLQLEALLKTSESLGGLRLVGARAMKMKPVRVLGNRVNQ
ncbi:hypothetical protein YC2023_106321 [Brassica napus]